MGVLFLIPLSIVLDDIWQDMHKCYGKEETSTKCICDAHEFWVSAAALNFGWQNTKEQGYSENYKDETDLNVEDSLG
jgi:hypothetical protein